ncbi:MAG: hypothetical protein ACD_73C00639G0001 [uncultured bacterium]|nr:MAG: hypothetical protein ACD_73C00639G0001 [uncultured bacterium]
MCPYHASLQHLSLASFFLMGLLGSSHCLGMCGPLSLIFLVKTDSHHKKNLLVLAIYHIARLLIYSILGVSIYSLGHKINFFIPSWVFIIFLALFFLFFLFYTKIKLPRFIQNSLFWINAKSLKLPATTRSFIFGFMTPLIPCGLLFAALSMTPLSSSGTEAGFYMFLFGLGTALPLFLGQIGLAYGLLTKGGRYFAPLSKIIALISFAISLYFFYKH